MPKDEATVDKQLPRDTSCFTSAANGDAATDGSNVENVSVVD
jgi:hypothetical protein